jgi:hypothetical protein
MSVRSKVSKVSRVSKIKKANLAKDSETDELSGGTSIASEEYVKLQPYDDFKSGVIAALDAKDM